MTNLAVFEDLAGDLFIQISAKHLPLSRALFVAASRSGSRDAAHVNPAETVCVAFGGDTLVAFYLVIASVSPDIAQARFKKIGQLEETDSINILNHIVDILAYP
jgi:hypothetical protein